MSNKNKKTKSKKIGTKKRSKRGGVETYVKDNVVLPMIGNYKVQAEDAYPLWPSSTVWGQVYHILPLKGKIL